jgi:peptide/nickel transport system ATP-binding protein
MDKPVIEIKDLRVEFYSEGNTIPAIDGVGLSVYPGETLGLVGESGCGKSTVALAAMRILPRGISRIATGEILFDGKDLTKLSEQAMRDIRGNDISMIFQDPMTSLNPVYTIGRQLQEGLFLHFDYTPQEVDEHILNMLKLVNIPRPDMIMKSYPHELSGGMQQRVMIAMALLCDPELLIADEPTTALDVTVQAQILSLMNSIQEKRRMGMILITHDLGVVAQMCQRVCVMYAGQIVETASIDTILERPLHPYTKGLLGSMPDNTDEGPLKCIEGNVPLPGSIAQGCRFADRCADCCDACRTQTIELFAVGAEHHVRCLKYEDKGAVI